MMEAREILNTVETLGRLPKAGEQWSTFESEPFGPTDECFSIEDIVYLSRRGATDRDLYHFSRCESCFAWMLNFVRVKAHMPALTKSVHGSWWHDMLALFDRSKRAAEANEPNTVLYVPFSEINVADLTQPDLSVKFGILSAPSGNFDAIDAGSLRLCGALTGGDATLQTAEYFGLHYGVARFQKVTLGDAVKDDLSKHRAASHSICLSGRFKGDAAQDLRGQAYVNLVRA